jgi:hypothetical protein
MELKFRDADATASIDRTATLTRDNPRTAITIPVPRYHHRTSDPAVSFELTLSPEGTADAITSVWLESRLVADAPVLNQEGRSTREPWTRDNWNRTSIKLELTESAIDRHRQEHAKRVDALLKKLTTLALRSSSFEGLAEWARESPELRNIALDYAELQAEFRQATSERQELIEEDQERLSELPQQLAALVGQQPQVAPMFQKYQLDQRENLEIAKTYDLFADFLTELDLWAEAMNQFLASWRKANCLDYRLYVTTDHREIDVVITETF